MKLLQDPRNRALGLIGILVVLALALAGPFLVGADARHLSAFAAGEQDASLARGVLDGRASRVEAYLSTPHQLADIEEPRKALLVIIGPERRYSESEADAVVAFLRAGGNVILADEGGYGNDIAAQAGWAFHGQRLLDTRNHLADPTLVVGRASLDGRDYSLLFNNPTALRPLSNAGASTVLVASSDARYPEGSFLDGNDDGEIDVSDSPGPFPLVVRTTLGEGTLILVADTGFFMNQQTELIEYDNDDFLAQLAGGLVPREDGVVVLDEARHAPAAPVAAFAASVRTLGRATSGFVAPLVTLGVLVAAGVAAWLLTRPTEDWSHHAHDLGHEVPVPADVRPDLERAQRMARRRIAERFNIPMEQVAAMPAEQLVSLTGDRILAEAAAGTLKSDPAPLFSTVFPNRPEAKP